MLDGIAGVQRDVRDLRLGQRRADRKLDRIEETQDRGAKIGIAARQDVTHRQLDRALRDLSMTRATMVSILAATGRNRELLEAAEERQLHQMVRMDTQLKKIELEVQKNHRCLAAGFQLMVNLQKGDIPVYVLVIPDPLRPEEGEGFGAKWQRRMKKAKRAVRWKKYYRLFVCDEGPSLLPGQIPKSEEPAHDGIEIADPGPLLRKLAAAPGAVEAAARGVGRGQPRGASAAHGGVLQDEGRRRLGRQGRKTCETLGRSRRRTAPWARPTTS